MLLMVPAAWICALKHRKKGEGFPLICIPVLLLAYFVVTCLHRTLGGVQFGNRYLVDILPCAFLALLLWKPKSKRFEGLWLMLGVFGAAVNLIGTVFAYNNLL